MAEIVRIRNKPVEVFDKLVSGAIVFQINAQGPRPEMIGKLVEMLSEKDREELKKLKSDDIKTRGLLWL